MVRCDAEVALADLRIEGLADTRMPGSGTGRRPCSTGSRCTCPCPRPPSRSRASRRRRRCTPRGMPDDRSACTGPSHRRGDRRFFGFSYSFTTVSAASSRAAHLLEHGAVAVRAQRLGREVVRGLAGDTRSSCSRRRRWCRPARPCGRVKECSSVRRAAVDVPRPTAAVPDGSGCLKERSAIL